MDRQCCCFMEQRTGCMTIAFLTMFFHLKLVVLCTVGIVLLANQPHALESIDADLLLAALTAVLFLSLVGLVTGMLLLYGVTRHADRCLLSWLVFTLFWLCLALAVTTDLFVSTVLLPRSPWLGAAGGVLLLVVVVFSYWWWVVWRYRRWTRREREALNTLLDQTSDVWSGDRSTPEITRQANTTGTETNEHDRFGWNPTGQQQTSGTESPSEVTPQRQHWETFNAPSTEPWETPARGNGQSSSPPSNELRIPQTTDNGVTPEQDSGSEPLVKTGDAPSSGQEQTAAIIQTPTPTAPHTRSWSLPDSSEKITAPHTEPNHPAPPPPANNTVSDQKSTAPSIQQTQPARSPLSTSDKVSGQTPDCGNEVMASGRPYNTSPPFNDPPEQNATSEAHSSERGRNAATSSTLVSAEVDNLRATTQETRGETGISTSHPALPGHMPQSPAADANDSVVYPNYGNTYVGQTRPHKSWFQATADDITAVLDRTWAKIKRAPSDV